MSHLWRSPARFIGVSRASEYLYALKHSRVEGKNQKAFPLAAIVT
jgi:hypothetical protein